MAGKEIAVKKSVVRLSGEERALGARARRTHQSMAVGSIWRSPNSVSVAPSLALATLGRLADGAPR